MKINEWFSKLSPNVFTGYVLGTATYVGLAVVCCYCGMDVWLNYALLFFGSLVGWVAGILATPDDPDQKRMFTAYAKAISLFVSGFIVAKVDRLFESATADGALPGPIVVGQLVIFGSAVLLGALFTFIGRKYAGHAPAKDETK